MQKLIIATHHQAGAILLWRIFRDLARRQDRVLLDCSSPQVRGEPPQGDISGAAGADILFDRHSTFKDIPPRLFEGACGVHLICDPRMVVVSSASYHQRSKEPWLHIPRQRFGGLSYQQKIQSLPTDQDRFRFEMDERSGRTIRDMRALVGRNETWRRDVKLEDLLVDDGLEHFHKLFRHLGFLGSPMVTALRVALIAFKPEQQAKDVHAREPNSWRDFHDPALEARFRDLFGGSVEALGYSWDR